MKVKKIDFAIEVITYNFSIEYSKKRKINPFEYILLELANNNKRNNFINFLQSSTNNLIKKDIKLIDFTQNIYKFLYRVNF